MFQRMLALGIMLVYAEAAHANPPGRNEYSRVLLRVDSTQEADGLTAMGFVITGRRGRELMLYVNPDELGRWAQRSLAVARSKT